MKMKVKILVWLLTVLMVVSSLPLNVLAAVNKVEAAETPAYSIEVTCDEAMGEVEAQFIQNFPPGMNPPLGSVWRYSAYPKKGYHFVQWEIAGEPVGYAKVFDMLVMPEDTSSTLRAVFAEGPGEVNLTVKFDHGEAESGKSLEDIVQNVKGRAGANIRSFEILSGTLTSNDLYFLRTNCVNNSHDDVSIFIGPSVDVSASYGATPSIQIYANLLRFEAEGFNSLAEARLQSNVSSLPTLWIPNVQELGGQSSVFSNSDVAAIYLPNLNKINNKALQGGSLKHLILTGEMPTVSEAAFDTNPALKIWVPQSKADDYSTVEDANPADGKWYGCEVVAYPDSVAGIEGLVEHIAADFLVVSELKVEHEEAVILAREIASALPYSSVTGALQTTVNRINAAYDHLSQVKANDIIERINALPSVGSITLDNREMIETLYEEYSALSAEIKRFISQDSVDKLNAAYVKLNELLIQEYLGGDAAYIAAYNDKFVFAGGTVQDIQPSNLPEAVTSTRLVRGSFTADQLKMFYIGASLIADKGVIIENAILPQGFCIDNNRNKEYLELPGIEIVEHKAIQRDYSYMSGKTFQLILPDVVEILDEAYYDYWDFYSTPNYISFMPKLIKAYDILRSDKPLILPRLQSGRHTYMNSAETKVFLPSLENAEINFFNRAATQSVWLPKLKTIGRMAFKDSAVSELYLGSAPPVITGDGSFDGMPADRTVYVPGAAVDAYKASGDGERWNGFIVKSIGESTTAADFVNYFIGGLPENDKLTVQYAEWIHSLEEIIDGLTEEQKNSLQLSALESAVVRIEEFENSDLENVIAQIAGIKEVSEITVSDRLIIEGARSAYQNLSDISKKNVTNLSKLEAAETKLAQLLAADIASRIDLLPTEITTANKDQVRGVYADYLKLDPDIRQTVTNRSKLINLMGQVVQIEKDTLSAGSIDGRISALPPAAEITLLDKVTVFLIRSDYENLSSAAKALVQLLPALEAAEAKIAALSGDGHEKTVYVSVEKFTLGRGYVKTPVPVTVKEGENVADLIVNLLGSGNYEITGAVDEGFYLASVKDSDRKGANIPRYILNSIEAAMGSLTGRNKQDWLGEFDYYSMSGWMYTVNNVVTSLGASQYTYDLLNDGDVIRWQFTVYGHGADLGYDSISGGAKLITTANKDALTKQIAIVDSSPEKLGWFSDEAYAQVYGQALEIVADLQSTQGEVDAIAAQLADTPQINSIGNVTVIIKDTVPRQQYKNTAINTPVSFKKLSGLGEYQQPFGMILQAENVPFSADMTAIDVALAVLQANGYTVQTNSRGITGIGPVTSEDLGKTVAHLSAGDVGDVSKWVLSLNNQAIYDSSTYKFYPQDGDTITLEYSVDGGYDVGCYPYAGLNFSLTFSPSIRTLNSQYMYFAEGTTEFSYKYRHVPVYLSYPDQMNRFNIIDVTVGGVKYLQGEYIALVAGQTFTQARSVPQGAGVTAWAGYDSAYTIRILKSPQQLADMISSFPEISSLDTEEKEWQYYYDFYSLILETKDDYDVMTAAEQADVSQDAVTKLNASYTKVNSVRSALQSSTRGFYNAARALPLPMQITKKNLDTYKPMVVAAREILESYPGLKKQYAIETSGKRSSTDPRTNYDILIECEEKIALLEAGGGETIGVPTDYYDDIIISSNAFNLELGADQYAYEVVFKDWPRIADGAPIHIKDRLTFDIKDPEIFEIVAVDATWIDGGLGGGNIEYETVKYYLVPKKAGTTTFTVDYDEYGGRTPEMVVHVNDSDESSISNLDDKLTNINAIPKTRKYDTFYYWEGEDGAPFTFKVNGSDARVYVYDYLKYDQSGSVPVNTKTEYPVDHNGNVTVFLKDGYNPIEVTATYESKEVTQVYGIKGKVIRYEIINETNPGSATYEEGDTITINIIGLDAPVKKILRIYNPSATAFRYDVNLPRRSVVQSGGGQYTMSGLEVQLTGSGDITFTNGRIFQDWFGSPLYSETAQGNQGEIAPQSQNEFSYLPNITIHVEENPNYNPTVFGVGLSKTSVRPGETVTLSIPNLDVQYIADRHISTTTMTDEIYKAFTLYYTDIPGLDTIKSAEVAGKTNLGALKTINFTVPEDTAPGNYCIFGGYVDVMHGINWWLKYTKYFEAQLDDCILTVIDGALADARTAAIAELESYADSDNYDNAGKVALTNAINAGNTAINAAATIDEVNAALSAAKAEIDHIPLVSIPAELNSVYTTTGAWLRGHVTNPTIASIGGEWAVIGLARSGHAVAEGYYDIYLSNLSTELKKKEGVLSTNKYTEYARAILAVTAVGGDVTEIAGYNLLTYLADFDKLKIQGINGPIWALIAFDSYGYKIPTVSSVTTQTTRERLLNYILAAQLNDGGWSLSYSGDSGNPNAAADPDITAMAIQALASYYNTNPAVKAAVDKALVTLSGMQADNGTFGSDFGGGQSSESTAQVIVALTALGINPTIDERFIKNGNDAIKALLLFYTDGGGFKHILSGNRDGMATEQGYYALVSYFRLVNNKTALYNMSDVTMADDQQKASRAIALINAIGTVTLEKEPAITAARKAYEALTAVQKALVKILSVLEAAEARLVQLKAGGAVPTPGKPGQSGITPSGKPGQSGITPSGNTGQSGITPSGQPGRSVTATVGGVEYTVDEEIAAVMEDIAALMETLPADGAAREEIAAIFALDQAYQALSEEQRAFVANYSDLEAAMESIRAAIQVDGATGVSVSGLPWHVGIKVEPVDERGDLWAELQDRAGEKETLLALFDISLIDYVTGAVYEADDQVTVTMPVPDYEGYDGIVILHRKGDGSIEYIQPVINGDGTMTFVLRSFSAVGVLGYKGVSPVDLIAEEEAAPWWPWLLVALGVVAVIVVLALSRRTRKGDSAGV